VRPLAVFNIPGGALNANKPITRLEDLAGQKISAAGRMLGDSVSALGGTPISLISTELYPSVQRGMVQMVAIGFLAVTTFKLDEVTKYHLDAPLGMIPAGYFMNKESYAKLPEKSRRAIDQTTGEKLSRTMGLAAKAQQVESTKILSTPPHVVAKLDPAEAQRWQQKLAPIVDDWTKRTPNGAAILAAYRQELASLPATTDR
jgi:TRAP-type C4-dicarboxylate transport system substrate-binding protein